eukprot:gene24681-27904_t
MFGLRVLLLIFTSWLAGSNPLDSQRLRRNHIAGGSYLTNVRSVSSVQSKPSQEKRERAAPPRTPPAGNRIPPAPTKKNVYATPSLRGQHVPRPIATTSALPIVDIFFILSDMTKLPFVRMQYYWVLPTVAAMQARTNSSIAAADSELRVHILSDSTEILKKASSLGFYSYDLVPHIDKHQRFLNRVARTVNSTASELEFFRWKVLNHIVSDWNSHAAESPIRRVMVVNGEVLLTTNPAALYDRAVTLAQTIAGMNAQKNPDPPQAIYIADAVMLYSPEGLNAFDAYIDEWFNEGCIHELRRKSVGTDNRPWSDVILFERFANSSASTSATLRLKLFDTIAVDAAAKQVELKHKQALGCEPLSYYDNPYGVHVRVNGLPYQLRNQQQQAKQVSQDPNIHDLHIYGPDKEYPYCFMGFVHKHTKNMMYVYGRTLEILRGGEEAHTPTTASSLAGDMLLAPEKSREVYYIDSHGTRKFIANKEEFKNLFLAREQVIGRVPMGIIEAFRPLPPCYPWTEGEIISLGVGRTLYFVGKGGVLRPLASQEVLKRFKQTVAD